MLYYSNLLWETTGISWYFLHKFGCLLLEKHRNSTEKLLIFQWNSSNKLCHFFSGKTGFSLPVKYHWLPWDFHWFFSDIPVEYHWNTIGKLSVVCHITLGNHLYFIGKPSFSTEKKQSLPLEFHYFLWWTPILKTIRFKHITYQQQIEVVDRVIMKKEFRSGPIPLDTDSSQHPDYLNKFYWSLSLQCRPQCIRYLLFRLLPSLLWNCGSYVKSQLIFFFFTISQLAPYFCRQ